MEYVWGKKRTIKKILFMVNKLSMKKEAWKRIIVFKET